MNDRYIRQTALPNFGSKGQERLNAASVLVVGAGGLGVPALQYLNAMGVGRLGIADADMVALSNLQRQPLYTEKDVGEYKAEVIADFLGRQNSSTHKEVHLAYIQRDNVLDILKDYDLVVDASDNFATRYLINDACVILGKPFVYGGLFGYEGQVSVFNYGHGPTYRCLYPDMSDGVIADCNTHGVLGVLPGIIGNLQALEAVKVITGVGEVLSGSLMLLDTLSMRMLKMKITPIAENQKITELKENYPIPGCKPLPSVSPQELDRASKDYFLVDIRKPSDFEAFHLEGAVNIPLEALKERREEIPREGRVCLICNRAVRTKQAAAVLSAHGADLFELEGGLDTYRIMIGREGTDKDRGR